ncbi:hypothetical protein H6G54_23395 [Anabaena cylindrica FACHB-243]|uniref:Uncharacterized protein n=1 Tax=Anabaena cylindrica (strain ATCC 27899 / PCC 7122) TaxID=272123 RepID=K9ZIN6_ANACC|nr:MULTISPECIES: hypothetical protein [Anabaena]AFZ59066.1 hypothetical protein Anacy_3679 [Anabaena cylindrica PCC 7122]MBD2420595.1 hypothetical protein [Anabaena cylindrica FACHB-243]MBY5282346.1 hypothetical protein [Anabaena sp. CCAP 1446/1C]MBY5309243.1 hypothetical protein [Anabaena sp. CCAP 1446/1C]MCM2408553.1 hypothetical protein [Anabaena sp. CCAP 1446/1C]
MILTTINTSVLSASFLLVSGSISPNFALISVANPPQILAKQQINNKTSQPHPVFKSILPKLKKNIQINILLPKYIPESDGENPLYAIIETATKNKYEILLSFSPDCNGGTACRLSIITGEAVTSKTPKLTGKAISLAKGMSGYFVDFQCGANCSDATLTWRKKAVQYRIGLKAGKQADLVKMARSVITQ